MTLPELPPPPPPETKMFTSTRFELVLPERSDRVRVTDLTTAFEKLGNEAMHLTLGNTYSGQQTLQGDMHTVGSQIIDFDLTVSRNEVVGSNLTVNGIITSFDIYAPLSGRVPGGLPVYFLGAAGAGQPLQFYDYATAVPAPPLHWTDNGTWLWPSAGRGVMANTGSGIALEAGGSVRMYWDGTWMRHSYSIHSDNKIYAVGAVVGQNWDLGRGNSFGGEMDVAGTVTIHGSNLYMEGSRAVIIRYRGDLGAIEMPYGNGVYSTGFHSSGAGFYWEAGNNVRTYWDGANIHNTYSLYSDGPVNATAFNPRDNTVYVSNGGGVYWLWNGAEINTGHAITTGAGNITMWGFNAQAHLQIYYVWGGIYHVGGWGMGQGGHMGRPSDQAYIWNNLYVYWDVDAGHHMHSQAFVVTSARALKDNIADDRGDALARVMDRRVRVVTWDSPREPATGGRPDLDALETPRGPLSPPPDESVEQPEDRLRANRMQPTGFTSSARQIGFLADEMIDVVPEVVSSNADGPAGINYGALVAVLWGAVRQLNDRLEALENAA